MQIGSLTFFFILKIFLLFGSCSFWWFGYTNIAKDKALLMHLCAQL